jgi:hypothetical protein
MVQKRQVFVVMEASGIKGIFETREGALAFIKETYKDARRCTIEATPKATAPVSGLTGSTQK